MCIIAKSWITNVKTNIKCFKLNKMFHSIVYKASFKAFSSRNWPSSTASACIDNVLNSPMRKKKKAMLTMMIVL